MFIRVFTHGSSNLKNCRTNPDLRCYWKKKIRTCHIITCLTLCQILKKHLRSGRFPPSYYGGICTALDNISNTECLCPLCSTLVNNANYDQHPAHIVTDIFLNEAFYL